MADARRREYLAIFVIIGVVILAILIISSFVIYFKVASISGKVESKLNEVNVLLEKLNSNLEGLDTLNSKISEISQRVSSMEGTLSNSPNKEQLNSINTELSSIKGELQVLSQKYPPSQEVYLNNINQTNLNGIINDAVNLEFSNINRKVNINLILNILFGSLISIGGISFSIYYVIKKIKQKKTEEEE